MFLLAGHNGLLIFLYIVPIFEAPSPGRQPKQAVVKIK
jgi:hypothetical protein